VQSFANWDWVPEFLEYNVVAVAAAVLIVLALERIGATTPQPAPRWRLNVLLYVLYAAVAALAAAGGFDRLFDLARTSTGGPWFKLPPPESLAGQGVHLLLALLVYDFFQYWVHRAMHRLPWLWRLHKLHHSDAALHATTALREHWLQPLFVPLLIWVPVVVLFQFSPPAVWPLVITGVFVLSHGNLRWHWGAFGRVLVGPQYHRIHHSRLPQHRDHNFADIFPLWDWLFGTAVWPKRNDYPPTGLTTGLSREAEPLELRTALGGDASRIPAN
jgi:sterol desaturase/sphingolipid hydroxylase (fatty acid hydroxylase superfamily)